MEDYQVYTFPNGIRVVHKLVTNSQIAHLGIMLDIGSRDEQPSQQGLAHFWEHMAFKGTKKRNAYHILNTLERVGGELNAYTTKEKICFHASILKEHFEKALDVVTDIAFNPTFPEKHVEREKGVILEEMAMYHDSPEEAIQDDFDSLIFENHPLGTNILGTAETVQAFERHHLERFVLDNIDTERIVVSSVGNLPFKKVLKLVEKYLAPLPAQHTQRVRVSPNGYHPQEQVVHRAITQAQVAIGRRAYSLTDTNRLPFFMLVNHLGGPSMNARLNLSVREKYGLAYSIDAQYTPYLDTGFFAIYFGTEPKKLSKALSLVYKELEVLRNKPLTSTQLHYVKQQLMGQMAMSEEGNLNFMLMMAKSMLDIGRIDSLSEIFEQIQGITATQLQDIAQEMFSPAAFCSLTFEPES
ncbi:MAG: pitrilysin family protein [Spirosomataceae bacterium]